MRVAIVGFGGAGSAHLQALDHVPAAQVVAVSDPSPAARARANQRGLAVYATASEMLSHARPDVVTICSPPCEHPDLTRLCLEAGVHVMCEKPLAIATPDALNMMRTASRVKRHLLLATKFRHVSDVLAVQRAIADGLIGEALSFSISFCSHVDMTSRWNSRQEMSGGGVIIDNGCHAFDIVSFLFGTVSGVHASRLRPLQDLEVEDSALIQVQAANGIIGSIELSWSYFTGRDTYLTVQGSEGAVEIGWKTSRICGADGTWRALEAGRYCKVASHQAMYEALERMVSKGGDPWISAVDALRTVAAVEASYRSLQSDVWERVEVKDFGDEGAGRRKRA